MNTILRGKDLIKYFADIISNLDGSDNVMLLGDGFIGIIEEKSFFIMEDVFNSSYNVKTKNKEHFINVINKPNIIVLFDRSKMNIWKFMNSDFVKNVNANTDFNNTIINSIIKFDEDKAIITLFSE